MTLKDCRLDIVSTSVGFSTLRKRGRQLEQHNPSKHKIIVLVEKRIYQLPHITTRRDLKKIVFALALHTRGSELLSCVLFAIQ